MRTVLSAATEKRNRNKRHRSIPVPHAVFEVVREQHAEPRAHQAEPRLLDRVREVIRFRHYSLRTEEAYLGWIRRFVRFHGNRHPETLGTEEVRSFLTDLAVNGKVAAPTQNQALSALLFLYQQVLKKKIGWLEKVERAKRPVHKPLVLTRGEVHQRFVHPHGTTRLMASLLSGSGLRLTECLRLRVKDLDFGYGHIEVRDGKGAKDRVTMLPVKLAEPLQRHLRKVKAVHEEDLEAGFGAHSFAGCAGAKISEGQLGSGRGSGKLEELEKFVFAGCEDQRAGCTRYPEKGPICGRCRSYSGIRM